MPKGVVKGGKSGKAIKDKTLHNKLVSDNETEDEVDLRLLNHGNESKQRFEVEVQANELAKKKGKRLSTNNENQKSKIKSAKRMDQGSLGEPSKKCRSLNTMKATVVFQEDGDEVEFEVEGQLTDFASEAETEINSESDEEMGPQETGATVNNNAIQAQDSDEEDSEIVLKLKDLGTSHDEEEQGMQRFVDYIRKQGLMIVQMSQDTAKSANTFQGKNNERNQMSKVTTDFVDDGSVITVYQNAIKQAVAGPVKEKMSSKHDSSSSDAAAMDTSDEMEKMQVDFVNANQLNRINFDIDQNVVGNNDRDRHGSRSVDRRGGGMAYDDQQPHTSRQQADQ